MDALEQAAVERKGGQRGREAVVVFAGEPDDQVGRQGEAGQAAAGGVDGCAVLRPGVGPPHGGQHAVVGRLQGHVQVARDERVGERLEQVGGEVRGLDRRQPQAGEAGQLEQAEHERGEVGAVGVTVGADVDARQHDLAAASGERVARLGYGRIGGQAPRCAAGQAHRAVRAAPGAAVLDFERKARAVALAGSAPRVGERRGAESPREAAAGRERRRTPAARSICSATGSAPAALAVGRRRHRDAGVGELFGPQRGGAAGHDHRPAVTAASRRASWRDERSASPVTPQVMSSRTSAWAGSATARQP